jgi:hypothetical protein
MKNASTYIEKEAYKQEWNLTTIPYKQNIARCIILRDPMERYLSALNEDICRYINRDEGGKKFFQTLVDNSLLNKFFDFLFNHKIFLLQDHTELQYNFIKYYVHEVGIQNITFIKMTDKLGDNLNLFLELEGYKGNFTNNKIHLTDTSDIIYNEISKYFLDGKNFSKQQKLYEYLQPDYDFINSINFFNKS